MLVIREAQMRALEAGLALPLFETRMIAHLREHHPMRFGVSRREELQALVRRVVSKAKSYGIDGFAGCAVFVELMAEFGEDFPRGCTWAEESLAATAKQTAEQRAEALLEAAGRHLDAAESRRAAQMDKDDVSDDFDGDEAVLAS